MSDSMTAAGVRLMQENARAQLILSERLIEESSLLRNELLMSIFDKHPTQRIPIHPWKHNLRDMSRMLAGEIDLPHLEFIPDHFNLSDAEQDVAGSYYSSCKECLTALALKGKYQQELLSKE